MKRTTLKLYFSPVVEVYELDCSQELLSGSIAVLDEDAGSGEPGFSPGFYYDEDDE